MFSLAIIGFGIDTDKKIAFEILSTTLVYLGILAMSRRMSRFADFRIDTDILMLILFACIATVQAISHPVKTEIPRMKLLFRTLYYFYVVAITFSPLRNVRILPLTLFTVLLFSSYPFHWVYILGTLRGTPLLLLLLYFYQRYDRGWVATPFALFVLGVITTMFSSLSLSALYWNRYLSGMKGLMQLSIGWLLFSLIARKQENDQERDWIIVLALFSATQILFFFAGVTMQTVLQSSYNPLTTKVAFLSGVNVNDISGFLVLTLPIFSSFYFSGSGNGNNSKKFRMLATLLIAGNLLLLYVSKSRSAWPVALFSLIFFFYLHICSEERYANAFPRIRGRLLFGSLFFIALASLLLYSYSDQLVFLWTMKSLYTRTEMWTIAFETLRNHPFVGAGPEHYSLLASHPIIANNASAFMNVKSQYSGNAGTMVHCHNLFMQMWLHGGAFYFISLFGFVSTVLFFSLRKIRNTSTTINASITILFAIFFQGIMNYHFMDMPVWLFFWIMLALISRSFLNDSVPLLSNNTSPRSAMVILFLVIIFYHAGAINAQSHALQRLHGIRFMHSFNAFILQAPSPLQEKDTVKVEKSYRDLEFSLNFYPKSVILRQQAAETAFFLHQLVPEKNYLDLAEEHYYRCARENPHAPFCLYRSMQIAELRQNNELKALYRKQYIESDPFRLIISGKPAPF